MKKRLISIILAIMVFSMASLSCADWFLPDPMDWDTDPNPEELNVMEIRP